MEDLDSEDNLSNKCLDIVFRKARVFDVDNIFKIYNDSAEYLDKESKEWIQSIVRSKSKRVRIYVGVENDKIIGFLIVYKKRKHAYIDALALDTNYRGKGIGRCFLNYIEKFLASEKVEKIYITVKNHNNRALAVYIKSGYEVSRIVFLLEARLSDININADNLNEVLIEVHNKKNIVPKTKLLDTVIWNNFTWDADLSVHRMSREEIINIVVYRKRKIMGMVQVVIEDNRILVDRLALSYYKPSESLKIIINSIKNSLAKPSEATIIIPVDSTKTSLLKTLISIGFKIVDSEYVLHKNLLYPIDKIVKTMQ